MQIATENFDFTGYLGHHGIAFGVGFGPCRRNDPERRKRYFDFQLGGHVFALGGASWELVCERRKHSLPLSIEVTNEKLGEFYHLSYLELWWGRSHLWLDRDLDTGSTAIDWEER